MVSNNQLIMPLPHKNHDAQCVFSLIPQCKILCALSPEQFSNSNVKVSKSHFLFIFGTIDNIINCFGYLMTFNIYNLTIKSKETKFGPLQFFEPTFILNLYYCFSFLIYEYYKCKQYIVLELELDIRMMQWNSYQLSLFIFGTCSLPNIINHIVKSGYSQIIALDWKYS